MTGHDGQLRVWGRLPDRYRGRRVAASTIDAQGRIVALLVAPEVDCSQRGGGGDRYDATIVLSDGSDCHETVVRDLSLRFPKIDVLDDGFVLVAARCRMPSRLKTEPFEEIEGEVPRNALVIDTVGDTKAAFHAGDAIEHLMTDAAGTIWIGYFDESSICALWPVRPSRRHASDQSAKRMKLLTPGLIRWSGTGDPLWYATKDGSGPRSWMDCYALNVGRKYTWAYPYTGFPLVEIDSQGVRCVRRTPVRFSDAVVISGDRSAFLTTPGKHPKTPGAYELTFAHCSGGPIEAGSSTLLLLPDGTRPQSWARRKACRDHRMWLQFDDPLTWYVIEI